jgi:response regulator NasT
VGFSNKVNGMLQESVSRRVLVAEDEALIRMDLVETLTDLGYNVVAQAGNGEEAVALAVEHKPDICVLDVKMPKLDGISAAEKIIEQKIPVILLTAFSQRELVQRAAEVGVMNFLVKPWSQSELMPAIEIALARHEHMTTLEEDVRELQERFEARKLIDRAKSILMSPSNPDSTPMSEPDAFRAIQKISMDKRVTMQQVAQTIIDQLGPKK